MTKKTIIINNIQKLHATPIAILVQEAGVFDSNIYMEFNDKKVNAKSIMGMMTLSLIKGNELTITAQGIDEEEAAEKLANYILGICS